MILWTSVVIPWSFTYDSSLFSVLSAHAAVCIVINFPLNSCSIIIISKNQKIKYISKIQLNYLLKILLNFLFSNIRAKKLVLTSLSRKWKIKVFKNYRMQNILGSGLLF